MSCDGDLVGCLALILVVGDRGGGDASLGEVAIEPQWLERTASRARGRRAVARGEESVLHCETRTICKSEAAQKQQEMLARLIRSLRWRVSETDLNGQFCTYIFH